MSEKITVSFPDPPKDRRPLRERLADMFARLDAQDAAIERAAQSFRQGAITMTELEQRQQAMPMEPARPRRDTVAGAETLNEAVAAYARERGLTFTTVDPPSKYTDAVRTVARLRPDLVEHIGSKPTAPLTDPIGEVSRRVQQVCALRGWRWDNDQERAQAMRQVFTESPALSRQYYDAQLAPPSVPAPDPDGQRALQLTEAIDAALREQGAPLTYENRNRARASVLKAHPELLPASLRPGPRR
jgi:hypothetical protein